MQYNFKYFKYLKNFGMEFLDLDDFEQVNEFLTFVNSYLNWITITHMDFYIFSELELILNLIFRNLLNKSYITSISNQSITENFLVDIKGKMIELYLKKE